VRLNRTKEIAMSNQGNYMTAPLVFLELEEVLVMEQLNFLHWIPSLYRLRISMHSESMRDMWATLVPPEKRANLRKLHDELEPRYVITSRMAGRMDKLQTMDMLHRAGLSFVANNLHTMWRTEGENVAHRAEDIADWFTRPRSTATAFVILDNTASAESLCASQFALQTVTSAAGQGLTAAATARALEILRWQRRAAA